MLVDTHHVDPDAFEEVADHRNLWLQRGGDRLGDPVGFIRWEEIHAPGRTPRLVVGHRDLARLPLHDQAREPFEEAPERVHLQAVGCPGARGHAVVSAENQAGSVDE
jgi:hypothetical protein